MKLLTLLLLAVVLQPLWADDMIASGYLERRLTLEELREEALGHSSELESLRSALRQSRIDLAQARSGRWPEISFLATGSYLFNPMDAVTLTTDELMGFIDWGGLSPPGSIIGNEYITILDAQEPTYYQFGLKLTQPIFTWGKITNAVKLHELLVEVRELELRQKTREVEARTAVLVHSLFALEEMLEIADEQVNLARRLSDIARDSWEEGFIVEQQLLAARLKVRELELLRQELSRESRTITRQLELLTGIQGLDADDISPPELELTGLGSEEEVLGKALSGDREIFTILNLLKQVQQRSLSISRGSVYWKPDLALQVEAGYQGSRFPFIETDWYGQNDYDLTVTIALETTLWDGGRRIQDVRESREDLAASEISLQKARDDITDEAGRTYLQYELNRSRMEYHELKSQLFADRIASSRRQYESGVGSESDLLALQLEGLGHELQSLRTRVDAVRGFITLLLMTGENI